MLKTGEGRREHRGQLWGTLTHAAPVGLPLGRQGSGPGRAGTCCPWGSYSGAGWVDQGKGLVKKDLGAAAFCCGRATAGPLGLACSCRALPARSAAFPAPVMHRSQKCWGGGGMQLHC